MAARVGQDEERLAHHMASLMTNDNLDLQLWSASRHGRDQEVLDLLHRGADPDIARALHNACYRNHPRIAELLIKWGASLSLTDSVDGGTPLHDACVVNRMDCVRVLMVHNSPTDIKNKWGRTAMDVARLKGGNSIAKLITKYKTRPRDPLCSYPSVRQMSKLCVHQWFELGLHLGLTEDELHSMEKGQNSTASTLVAAKVKNIELKWKDIVTSLVRIGEYQQAERVCTEQGGRHDGLAMSALSGSLDFLKYLLDKGNLDLRASVKGSDVCLLNLACVNGHVDFAQFLVAEKLYDVNESLVHAAKSGHCSEAEFLLGECHADPNVTDSEGKPLLTLNIQPQIIRQLLKHGAHADNVYKAHSKHIGKLSSERPLDNPLPIFITGDGGVGKSTLLKSMFSSNRWILRIFFGAKPVTDVDEKTVGIIPYEIVTKEFGRVIFYDFAGQPEFYASHCAVLENALQTSHPIVLYLADLRESEQKAVDSIVRWMTLVQNQCTNLKDKAHVIVVGSHADVLIGRSEDPHAKESTFASVFKSFSKLEFVSFTAMDCRFADTSEIKQVKKLIQKSSAIIRSPETVSLNAHTFYIYLLESFKNDLAVSLKAVEERIHRDLNEVKSERTKNLLSFIPNTLSHLQKICDQLSKKGLILYLHNKKTLANSFIICDRATLLSRVTGTVFAPESFHQHCKLASSTGVVPLSKLSKEFESYNIEMLIAFMSHLELCFEITDKEVLDIVREHEQDSEQGGRYLFFPGLITLDIPEQVWKEDPTMSCHSGWIIECAQDIQFFDPRCLQVLILRLVFTFNLAPARKIQEHVPSLQRLCSVWKNGIFWCDDDGVNSLLQLSNSGRAFVLKMRSRVLTPQFLEVRSKIIAKVTETVKTFCPNFNTVESFINPQEVIRHPLTLAHDLILYSVSVIASAVAFNREDVKSEFGSLALSQLLQFEPYAGLDQDTLQCIHSDKNVMKNERVSNAFISHFASQVTANNHSSMYRAILIHCLSLSARASQLGSPKQELVHTLETWRDKTEGTYSCLRETLNKYSIFTGRNPLDLAQLAHCEVDPSMFSDPCEVFQQELDGTRGSGSDSSGSTSQSREPIQNVQHSLRDTGSPLTLSDLKRELRLTDEQLDAIVEDSDLPELAGCFENTEDYVEKFGLTPGQQTDVMRIQGFMNSTEAGMKVALKYWKKGNPYKATYRDLLLITLSLKKGDVAVGVCKCLINKGEAQTTRRGQGSLEDVRPCPQKENVTDDVPDAQLCGPTRFHPQEPR